MTCRCGIDDPYRARVRAGCFGSGLVECLCGGDFCVCHNHGVVDCSGCVDCEPTVELADDLFCHEDHAAAPPDGNGTAETRRGRNSLT